MPYSQKQWQDRIKDAQGNIVQEGTPFSAGNMNRIEQGIADAHAQLEEAARTKQTLMHGVSVLNGGVDAPVNIEIEGRTLIPMQNTVLDPLKYYVLADKRTKLKWSDATVQAGIAKFTAKAERPTLIRVANFEGKVAGSTLENPHKALLASNTSLVVPSAFSTESSQIGYDQKIRLDNTIRTYTGGLVSGQIAQQLFSFDLIAEVECQLGRIPRTTVADKAQWLKDNVAKLLFNWHGFGNGGTGNKSSLVVFFNNAWGTPNVGSQSNVTKQSLTVASGALNTVDANGFVHFLAYTDPSDGTTASTINTDYVELEIELKPEAILHAPRVPLYEVTKEHYDAINVTMLEDEVLRRYPSVEGVTHLQNPYIMAEGENLFPLFSEGVIHANAVLKSNSEFTIEATGVSRYSDFTMNVTPGVTYTLSYESDGATYTTIKDAVNSSSVVSATTNKTVTFTAPSTTKSVIVQLGVSGLTPAGTYTIKNPMLTLGAVAKPFTPRNPSYALFETKLAKIGNDADRLFEQDAKYFKRKAVEDVVLDGSLGWLFTSTKVGFKEVRIPVSGPAMAKGLVVNNVGKLLANTTAANNFDTFFVDATNCYVRLSNTETGFVESYTPTADEIKAYFNGWQVKTVDGANKPTAWKCIVDGTDAPTQTLDYVKANKAPNYTPYKLSYVLATPKVEEIKSEGAISVNGLTQIEVGSGVIVREKVVPALSNGNYYINAISLSTTLLKNKTEKILSIYKNGKNEKNATLYSSGTTNGKQGAYIKEADFDATAEYTVTYLVLDRQPFTSNPVNVSAQFANNVRSALEDTTKKVEDNTTAISVNTNILYDVLKRLKAGGL